MNRLITAARRLMNPTTLYINTVVGGNLLYCSIDDKKPINFKSIIPNMIVAAAIFSPIEITADFIDDHVPEQDYDLIEICIFPELKDRELSTSNETLIVSKQLFDKGWENSLEQLDQYIKNLEQKHSS